MTDGKSFKTLFVHALRATQAMRPSGRRRVLPRVGVLTQQYTAKKRVAHSNTSPPPERVGSIAVACKPDLPSVAVFIGDFCKQNLRNLKAMPRSEMLQGRRNIIRPRHV